MARNSEFEADVPVSPRDAQDAVDILGEDRAIEITGPGFLSGASNARLRQLVNEASQARKSMGA